MKEREWVQITDFGLAKMLSGEEEEIGEVIVQSGRVPIRWLAIETLTSGRYSFKTDIWAYGKRCRCATATYLKYISIVLYSIWISNGSCL